MKETKKSNEKRQNVLPRRRFLGMIASGTAAFSIVPGFAVSGLGHTPPSDKLNIAGVGVGGIGRRDLSKITGQNIVALCDVDWDYAAKTFKDYPDAKLYKDYRVMLEKQKDIDAVLVATPDHTHAIVAMAAMKLGKHVFVQKPLCHSVYETRLITETARKYKVASQMGNQGNSGESIRQICEWIWNGVIGEIREVHAWTNRPMGDMGCHIIDPIFKALKLKYPISVQGSSTQVNTESAPIASRIKYEFPARENLPKVAFPEVTMYWYDGGLMPDRPDDLEEGIMMGDWNGGTLFIGTKGKLVAGLFGDNPILFPKSLKENYQNPPQSLLRIKNGVDGHWMDWVRACKESPENRVPASSNFEYSGPLTESVVMGNLAIRLQDLKKKLLWDGQNMRITNISDRDKVRVVTSDKFTVIDGHPHFDTQRIEIPAKSSSEEWIKHTYREGWSL